MSILHILFGIVLFSVAWLIVVGIMYGISKLIAICIIKLIKQKESKDDI